MTAPGAAAKIGELAARWRRRSWRAAALSAAAVALPLATGAALAARAGAPLWAAGIAAAAAVAGALVWRRCRPGPADPVAMALHLDRARPEAEASCELLLAAPEELPLVARLQRRRVEAALGAVLAEVELPAAPRRRARLLALASLAASLAAWLALPSVEQRAAAGRPLAERPASPAAPGPRITEIRTTVTPPAYTGRRERTSAGLDLRAEQGAVVTWRVAIEGAAEPPALVFDEAERLVLDRLAGGVFTARRAAEASHLYRLEAPAVAGAGAYARFDVVPDLAPVVEIATPPAFVELAPETGGGLEARLDVRVEVRDDYGVGPAWLVATVASGFGELVEFRERRLELERGATSPDGAVVATSRLDLEALGMKPGVELFFFAEARDRRRPQPNVGRSATHVVRMPGGSGRSSELSVRLPVLRVPELFRSQRQIILDTERLLADEPRITREELRRRAEGLGLDQRALRMRYGGLLGEEFEDQALEGLGAGLVHEHDSAEIATYFDSEVKAQLKAALAEMWGAEGRLRGLAPREALPYEYRALRLLKRVQESSRLYVAKVGFEPPLLDPAATRLTGDLDEIRTVRRSDGARAEEAPGEVLVALAALEDAAGRASAAPPPVLAAARTAARLLAARAREDPDAELSSLESLRAWIAALEEGRAAPAQLRAAAAAALWSLLPEAEAGPALRPAVDTSLAASYRRRLAAGGAP